MAWDLEMNSDSNMNQNIQSYVTSALREGDAGGESEPIDIYDLEVVSGLLETDSSSFFAVYAQGDWDPTAIPPIPTELAPILGEPQSTTRPSLRVERRASPPALEESVEMAYRTYLVDAKTPSPGSLESRRLSDPMASPVGYFLSDSRNASFSRPEHNASTLIEPDNNSIEDPIVPSNSIPGSPFSATSPFSAFSQAVASRFAAKGHLEGPLPKNEKQRRMAVRRYFPLSEEMDFNLERIVRLCKMRFSVAVAAISIVDTDYVHGTLPLMNPLSAPRGEAMCSHTILMKTNKEPFLVLNALEDWRFRNNPTVTGPTSVRFYAAYPLRTEDGFNIGTLCLIDTKPWKEFNSHQRAQLKEFSQMVLHELDSRQRERHATTRDQMQSSIEAFNHDLVSESKPADQMTLNLVDTVASTLKLEGVLILDAQRDTGIRNMTSPRTSSYSETYTPSHFTNELVPDGCSSIAVLAASQHATINFKPTGWDYVDLMSLFKEYPSGICYNTDSALPHPLRALLPTGATAAAAALIFRGTSIPLATICVYTTQPNFAFEIPDSLLNYLRAMGSILCTIQEKQALSLANKAKVDFIANISHELRTPLHGVLASCDLLNESDLSRAQKSLLDTAQACASSLTETINHVLDFTKATSRASNSTREAVDLAWLIESTMNGGWLRRTAGASLDASAAGELYTGEAQTNALTQIDQIVEPIIEIQPIDNWNMMVDKAGLRRILLNLIGNSMRFTKNGYVKVGLYRIGADEGARRTIEIVVEDTGVGMSSEFVRERLFHPFSQADSYSHGIGLGLAIVRSILKSSGIDGTINVKSQLGVGTRMAVRLMATVVNSEDNERYRIPQIPIDTTLPSTGWYGFREEHRGSISLRNSLRQSLIWWNCEAPEVDASKARLLVADCDRINIPDLLTLATGGIKLLLLSSVPTHQNIFKFAQEHTERGGSCLIVVKPVGPHFLARALTRILDGGTRTPSPGPTIKSPKLTLPLSLEMIQAGFYKDGKKTTRPLRRIETYNRLRVLVVEDNSSNRKVLSAFLRTRECEFVEACDGVEGVQVFRKYPDSYFDVILMDLQMPLKDGFQATREIRDIESNIFSSRTAKDTTFQPAHIYALTGLASSEDKERATTVGFNGYLVKPMAFKVLDAILKSVFEKLSR